MSEQTGQGFVGFSKSQKPELNPSAQTIPDCADLMDKVHLQTEGAAGSRQRIVSHMQKPAWHN